MNLLRGLLFDNLGLKLVALLMAVVVYLNVYTDRPATMLVTFPLRITGLGDSLALSGPAPAAVQAELRGTGKQLIRLRLTEPQLEIPLAGVEPGRFERVISAEDLPLGGLEGLSVERVVGPRVVELRVDRRVRRDLPVAVRADGEPGSGWAWKGAWSADPPRVTVSGPQRDVAALDSVALETVTLDGRRDTVRVRAMAARLPEWCAMEPASVTVTLPLVRVPQR
uniref:YbbR-like domain-containing protein n=1 Tax=Eiseniibacteriota bacterium TaxID=2212470 RepID=A0A832I2U1_UNCEI